MEALLKIAHDDAVKLRDAGFSEFDTECSILTAYASFTANSGDKTIAFLEIVKKVYEKTPPRPDLPATKDSRSH